MKRKYKILKPLLTKSGAILGPGTEIEGEEKDLEPLIKKGAIKRVEEKKEKGAKNGD